MKCQILFSGKNKKNNIILSSAENAQRVVKVKRTSGPLLKNNRYKGQTNKPLWLMYNICLLQTSEEDVHEVPQSQNIA